MHRGVLGADGVVDPDHRLLQRQARALGDQTRYEIFRYVAESAGPVGVAAITAHMGLNHNSVRQHLAKLCDAGLLLEELGTRAGRGRPPLSYRVAPEVRSNWGRSGAYQELSLLLLELVGGGRTPAEVGAAAGRRARSLGASPDDALDALEADMARDGFEPERMEGEGEDTVAFVLRRCPFERAASANRDVVCELHRGLLTGTVETLAGDFEITRFVAKDPKAGGCRLELRRLEKA